MFDPEDEKPDHDDNVPSDDPLEQGVSLEGLSEAFAEALGKSSQTDPDADADEQPQQQEPASDTADTQVESNHAQPHQPQECDDKNKGANGTEELEEDEEDNEGDEGLPDAYQDDTQGDDPCPISPHTIFEAMLFVGNIDNRPLESRRAADLMRGVEPEEIPEIVDHLNESYAENGCPYTIVAEGSGYRLKLTERFHPLRNKFYGRVREARLSQAAVDVLAIVAYRQPISSEEVNRLRDKSCSHILSQLVRRRLLHLERAADKSTKPVYRTTDRFLELFGLDNISELPKSEGVVG